MEPKSAEAPMKPLAAMAAVSALLAMGPTARAVDYVQCNAMQERFDRLAYEAASHIQDRAARCNATTRKGSSEWENCVNESTRELFRVHMPPMDELEAAWEAAGCPGKPLYPKAEWLPDL